ncbi:MAG TPA: helix-turn-helix domain-containing protein [Stellaceae bacterium]|nr:helix-turn-helix domain-containing protein [Stellaceae bacterium]
MNGATELGFEAEVLPFLVNVSASTQQSLLQNAVVHSVTAATVLFEQGEIPHFQHVLLAGSIHLFGRSRENREVLIESVAAPHLVVPAAVVTASPYLMQARTPEPSRLLLIHAATFRSSVATDPALAQAVIESLAGQFRRMVRQIKNLKLRPAPQRVGCYIIDLAKRQATPDRAVLPYGKNLIASELGMTRESFSRALGALHEAGIAVDGDTIFIGDRAQLEAVCLPDPLIDDDDGLGI